MERLAGRGGHRDETRARIIAFDGQIERGNRLGQFVDQHVLAGP